MAKRKKNPPSPNPLELIRQLHEQLKQCDPMPPPWDAYQSDDPFRHHNLLRRLEVGLKIPGFGPARHIVHRGDPPQREEFFPDRCWALQVMPSFHNWGLFAVFESRSLVRCAFVCKGDIPDRPELDYAVVDTLIDVKDWEDPVLDLLNKGSLLPTPDRSLQEGLLRTTRDGIGYTMLARTSELDLSLRFSNPRSGQFRALARAAYLMADRVGALLRHPQVSNFLRTWKGYTGGDTSEKA